eukprot:gene1052-1334_t
MANDNKNNHSTLMSLREALHKEIIPVAERKAVFFKTRPGEYGEHDQFLGVPTPILRSIAKVNQAVSLEVVIALLQSPMNEERLLALFILIMRYQKGDTACKESIYQLYQTYISHINNWNLVDSSAHLIVGAHLDGKDKSYLLALAGADVLWERRIAMVATLYFIRKNEFDWTIKIAASLLHDKHDLIHKAVGWMLREVGERNEEMLMTFLESYAHIMPRTMLRYAIEKLNVALRTEYLAKKKR